MGKNQIIRYAILLSKAFLILLVVFFTAFLFGLIHSSFSPAIYNNLIITDGFKAGWGINNIHFCVDCSDPDDISLGGLNNGMRLWLGLRGTLFFLLSFLIVGRCIKILKSVSLLNTFYAGNIRNFQLLAKYGLFAFILSAFNFMSSPMGAKIHFTIPFGLLGFSIACLVLSEIFKEGKLLLEDKNSIV